MTNLYIEPNHISKGFKNEDFCIGLKIEVEIPSRMLGYEGGGIKLQSRNLVGIVNLLGGEDGYLTTSYSDVIPMELTDGGNRQSIGIENLQIRYNSWFYPEITAKFVDLRGNAVLNPMENALDGRGEPSFLNALFTFPYPEFKITVKGQYGRPVKYRLAVQDVRASFNSNTGNFDFNVKFIGYMFGFLTDIPMRYVMLAPYNKFGGNDSDLGFFKDEKKQSTGIKIPTFVDFIAALNDIQINSESSEIIKKCRHTLQTVENKKIFLQNLYDTVAKFRVFLDVEAQKCFDVSVDGIQYTLAPKKINEDVTELMIKNMIEFNINNYIENGKENYYDFNDIVDNTNKIDYNCVTFLHLNEFKVDSNKTIVFEFDHKKDMNYLEGIMSYIEYMVVDANNKLTTEMTNVFEGVLNFRPTIGNIFQMLFAHVEKLHKVTNVCMKTINNSSKNRPYSKLMINGDIRANSDDVTTPPFPLLADMEGKYIWFDETNNAVVQNLTEKVFIEDVINSATDMSDRVATEMTKSEITSKWLGYPEEGIPTLLSDLAPHITYENSYVGCDFNINKLAEVLSKRAYLRYAYNKNISLGGTVFGSIEALNYFNTIKYNGDILRRIKQEWTYELLNEKCVNFLKSYLKGFNGEDTNRHFVEYRNIKDKKQVENSAAGGIVCGYNNGEVEFNGGDFTMEIPYKKDIYDRSINFLTSNGCSEGYGKIFSEKTDFNKVLMSAIDTEWRMSDRTIGFRPNKDSGSSRWYDSKMTFDEYFDNFDWLKQNFLVLPKFNGTLLSSSPYGTHNITRFSFFFTRALSLWFKERINVFGEFKVKVFVLIAYACYLWRVHDKRLDSELYGFEKVCMDTLGKRFQELDDILYPLVVKPSSGKSYHYAELTEEQKQYFKNFFSETVKINILHGDDRLKGEEWDKEDEVPTSAILEIRDMEATEDDETQVEPIVLGFWEKLNQLCEETLVVHESIKSNMSESSTSDKKLAVYMSFKQLYDRWKFGANEKMNITINNFKFYDAYYDDVSQKNLIDIDSFSNLLRNNFDGLNDISVYSFMWEICKQANFNLFALPVNIYEALTTKEKMEEIFTPFDYLSVDDENQETTYIAIYTHKESEHLNIIEPYNMYEDDGLDFFNDSVLKTDKDVPVFGVTFGLGDQHIFDNITVNMDSPKVTAHSLMSELMISRQGQTNGSINLGFEGHDIYETYASKSYTCKVEMLGCAQIMPLMYFQLNNIPLFKGGYMIVGVEHTLSDGTMKTSFTGVRLNKYRFNLRPEKLLINHSLEVTQNMDANMDAIGVSNKKMGERSVNYSKSTTLILIDAGHDAYTLGKKSKKFNFDGDGIWSSGTTKFIPELTDENNERGVMQPKDFIRGDNGNNVLVDVYSTSPAVTNENSYGGSGYYREYWGNRKIAIALKKKLDDNGYKTEIVSSKGVDAQHISSDYTNKINQLYEDNDRNCILISIHSNALSDNTWDNANYWSIFCQNIEYVESEGRYVTPMYEGDSYILAKCIATEASEQLAKQEVVNEIGTVVVKTQPHVFNKSQYGIRPTTFSKPATVLSENLFHTNKNGVRFLGSKKGRDTIVDIHYKGIERFFNEIEKPISRNEFISKESAAQRESTAVISSTKK